MPTIALSVFPLIALALFGSLGPVRGLIWTVLLGYLFLPEGIKFDIPGLPPINKRAVTAFSALLAVLVFRKQIAELPRTPVARHGFRVVLLLLAALLFLTPVATVATNTDNLVFAEHFRPGLTHRDIISMTFHSLVVCSFIYLGARFLAAPEYHEEFLKALLAVGLFYSLLALFEARMSPQLNIWIYGYFPHQWDQHIRNGAFRPVVFLRHGLWLGIVLFAVTIAAFALARQSSGGARMLYILTGIGMLVVLLLSRNLGALMLALLLGPAVLFLTRRLQLQIAAVGVMLFLTYPMLRQADVLPLDGFLAFVEGISAERAQSLNTRLDNEFAILGWAWERPLFGWGGWGRWRIVDETGTDITIADGAWAIVLGERGWLGYIGYFGVMSLAILHLGLTRWKRQAVPPVTAGLAIIMAGNMIYLIPNSALSPVGLLIFGTLTGFVLTNGASAAAPTTPRAADADDRPGDRSPRYTRFGPGTARPPSRAGGRQSPQKSRVSSR